MKNRVVSLLLIVVMLVGMMPAMSMTVSAAADPMKEGMLGQTGCYGFSWSCSSAF